MIRAKYSPESENLAKPSQGCKMFHVEQRFIAGNQDSEGELFHVERYPAIAQLRSSTMRQFAAFWILKVRAAGFES